MIQSPHVVAGCSIAVRVLACRAALHPLTVQSAGFLMVLTSLPAAVSAAEVLAACRVRWQVELAFKRLKSLLGLDRLPTKSRPLARFWMFAHLILALLIEDLAQDILEPPASGGGNVTRRRLALAHYTSTA